MKHLVCFVEEASAKVLLEVLINRFFASEIIDVQFQVFNGKRDLEDNLKRRISAWLHPNSVFLVLRDKDSGDCIQIKNRLLHLIQQTEKEHNCLVRIVCHELESFYLGDLNAVAQAFNIKSIQKNLAA